MRGKGGKGREGREERVGEGRGGEEGKGKVGKGGWIISLRLSFRLKRRQKYKIFKMRPIITRCTVTVITLSFIFRLKRATRHLIQNKLAFNVIIECTVMTS